MNAGQRFRYRLESLLRKRESDAVQLHHEQTEAHQRVDACARDVEAISAAIAHTEVHMRSLGQEGTAIDPDTQGRLRTYLKMLMADRERKRHKLAEARREYDDIGTRLRHTREGIKALEKHREGRRADFEVQWRRREQTAADELWLMRRAAKRTS